MKAIKFNFDEQGLIILVPVVDDAVYITLAIDKLTAHYLATSILEHEEGVRNKPKDTRSGTIMR